VKQIKIWFCEYWIKLCWSLIINWAYLIWANLRAGAIPSILCLTYSRSNWHKDEEFLTDDRALVRCVVLERLEELVVGTAGTSQLDGVRLSPKILALHIWTKAFSQIEWRSSDPFAIPQTSAWESWIINNNYLYIIILSSFLWKNIIIIIVLKFCTKITI